ncbi:MAG TPA: hypothetical protein DCE24_03280 [Porphyromonadaceae bacterium]|nr:hypothetical protein [Paramuribaculum sp.]HAB40857.1 hypothetical protein [Porphyromonadaceae bacterium]
MTKFLKTVIILIASLVPISAFSTNDNSTPTRITDIVILTPQPPSKNPNRPNAPARYFIECEYNNKFIKFKLPPFVESVDVEIENEDGIAFQNFVSAANPTIDLPSLTGTYTLRCTTDDGTVYEGTITL